MIKNVKNKKKNEFISFNFKIPHTWTSLFLCRIISSLSLMSCSTTLFSLKDQHRHEYLITVATAGTDSQPPGTGWTASRSSTIFASAAGACMWERRESVSELHMSRWFSERHEEQEEGSMEKEREMGNVGLEYIRGVFTHHTVCIFTFRSANKSTTYDLRMLVIE